MAINKINLDGVEYDLGGAKKILLNDYRDDLDIDFPDIFFYSTYLLKPNTLYLYEAWSEEFDMRMTGHFITSAADNGYEIFGCATTSHNTYYSQDLAELYSYKCEPSVHIGSHSVLQFSILNISSEYASEIIEYINTSFSVLLYELPITFGGNE